MIPVYAIITFLSLLFYPFDAYLELIRNCYEAYVIASFFTLMCHYIAPNLHEQKAYFRNVRPKPWVFPLHKLKTPRSGLTWFNITYVGVFQFCLTRPLFTLIAIIAQTQNRYCQYSANPVNGHLWIALLQGACVLTAMYCLVQFYVQLKDDIAPHRPFLKVLCIKLATFLGFWQTWLLGLLAIKNGGPLHPTIYLAAIDVHVGIPCMLVCFEMMIFACLFHWAFPWSPYDISHQLRGPERLEQYACAPHKALLEALNPWDYAKAAARGFWWLVHGVRHRREDTSYMVEEKEAGRMERLVRKASARTSALSDPGPERGVRWREGSGERERGTVG
jgi:hypothetical protein